ncbi:hypothetical protein ULMS_02490 [Patiriisocius marinistellae]|uniref:Lipocalin-like domain-containing protein n=2 Tax=Patiriisocius marinistellae TaxID=2494560 RepID=A0A5J4FYJ7_9FLAO|nr:hypothetical protein ULMS_02490 [Patiriisocius marinistellae]
MLVAITFTSCKNDDDNAVAFTQSSIAGDYSFSYLRSSDVEVLINADGTTITNTYLTEGSNFNVNWNFNSNGTFAAQGTYTITYTDTEDGEVIIETELTSIDGEGSFIVNEANGTLLLDFDNDDAQLFTVSNYSGNSFDTRYEEMFSGGGFEDTYVIEIGFVRQ